MSSLSGIIRFEVPLVQKECFFWKLCHLFVRLQRGVASYIYLKFHATALRPLRHKDYIPVKSQEDITIGCLMEVEL